MCGERSAGTRSAAQRIEAASDYRFDQRHILI
jgi:hypothetical protein